MKHHIGRIGFHGVWPLPLRESPELRRTLCWYNGLLSLSSLVGFPGSDACNAGNSGSVLGLGRSPGEENGNPLQCFFQKNPMDRKSLVGCSPWDHKESDMTEWLSMHACHHLGILSLNFCFVSEVWWNNDYKEKYMHYVYWLFPITPSAQSLWCPMSSEFWRTQDA